MCFVDQNKMNTLMRLLIDVVFSGRNSVVCCFTFIRWQKNFTASCCSNDGQEPLEHITVIFENFLFNRFNCFWLLQQQKQQQQQKNTAFEEKTVGR